MKIVRGIAVVVLGLAFVGSLVPLALGVLLLLHGSLEQFPTDEQQEAARLFAGLVIAVCLAVELGLVAAIAAIVMIGRQKAAARPGPAGAEGAGTIE